ncbi:MAG: putative sensor domain DACNV-containing protein [Gemmatimonadales bacterium]
MPEPAYAPALAAAAIVQDFFAGHPAAPAPAPHTVSAVVNTAFWASLRREEGRSPRVSVAMVAPAMTGQPMTFERPLPLDADVLVRLGPAVEGPGIHLGAWPVADGELRIWGAARELPDLCLVAEVVEPGLLVLKYQREKDQKFGNLAVLRGDQLRVVEEGDGVMPGRPALLGALLGSDTIVPWTEGGTLLTQLAVSMRRHRHGAALLVVPSGTGAWRDSIAQPTTYAMAPPFRVLAQLLDRPDRSDDDVRELVDAIAGLTAVDGAAILTHRFELLAFGATIRRREGHASIEQVVLTEPVVGDLPSRVPATELGGTRHLSAAQFVHDQRDGLAFVASQDGRFTVFAWSPGKQMVHGHRIEVLLL